VHLSSAVGYTRDAHRSKVSEVSPPTYFRDEVDGTVGV
jgi:hypothetical protein